MDELLSNGLLHWFVSGGDDATKALHLMMALPEAEQSKLIEQMGPQMRYHLAVRLPRRAIAGGPERRFLRNLFMTTPEAEADTLRLLVELRFSIKIGTAGFVLSGPKFDGPALRRIWTVLEGLPPAAVENNPRLWELERADAPDPAYQTGGFYARLLNLAGVGYESARLLEEDSSGADIGDPLRKLNRFDEAVRHEVGHAVDARIKASPRYCLGNAGGGNWQEHGIGCGAGNTMVGTMVRASAGGIQQCLSPSQRGEVISALQDVILSGAPDTIDKRLEALSFWRDLPTASQVAVKSDAVVRRIRIAFRSQEPWKHADAPIGGRLYQECAGGWFSYDLAARSRKVSTYQFAAPPEWFAEAYSAYYAPDERGKGAKLNDVDPATKNWFDNNVDNVTGGRK